MTKASRFTGLAAVMIVSLSAAGAAMAGVGGVGGITQQRSFALPQVCPTGNRALTPAGIKAMLKRRGYYAIRGLRYLKPGAGSWEGSIALRGGRYVATASRGFGIVRWQVSIDPCTTRVAIGRPPAATRTH